MHDTAPHAAPRPTGPGAPTAVGDPSRLRGRAAAATAAILLLVAFAPTLRELVQYWWHRPEYSHGFLMPVVAAWILWERRARFATLRPQTTMAGVLLLIPALMLLLLGEMKLSWFLKPYAFVASIGAVGLALYGWKAARLALPALVVLLLMCPLPGRIQFALTIPLKNTAALFATGMLDLMGIPATLEGNLIHVPGIEDLWVADACSGIRSLISLVSLAIIACMLWRRHWLLRVVVVLSAVPIAVFVNGLRIWLTGYLAATVSREAAEGVFHLFEGLLLFGIGALLLLLWAFLLDRITSTGVAS